MKINQALQKIQENFNNPCYIMMVGVPGCGKSTIISKIIELNSDRGFFVASTDDIIEDIAKSKGKTYSEVFPSINHKQIKKQMDENIQKSFNKGNHIIHDQTNMSSKSRTSKLSNVPDSYFKICLNVSVDDKVLFERLDKRAKETGKYIPKHVIDNMFNSYNPPTKKEGFGLIIEIDNT